MNGCLISPSACASASTRSACPSVCTFALSSILRADIMLVVLWRARSTVPYPPSPSLPSTANSLIDNPVTDLGPLRATGDCDAERSPPLLAPDSLADAVDSVLPWDTLRSRVSLMSPALAIGSLRQNDSRSGCGETLRAKLQRSTRRRTTIDSNQFNRPVKPCATKLCPIPTRHSRPTRVYVSEREPTKKERPTNPTQPTRTRCRSRSASIKDQHGARRSLHLQNPGNP